MLDLIIGGNGALAAIGAAILGTVIILWRAFNLGRHIERGRAAKRANTRWREANETIQKADAARLGARKRTDADILRNDGHRRS